MRRDIDLITEIETFYKQSEIISAVTVLTPRGAIIIKLRSPWGHIYNLQVLLVNVVYTVEACTKGGEGQGREAATDFSWSQT